MLRIRPHHFFCLLGFKGYGYNMTFVDNMDRISKTANKNPDTEVILVTGPDEICEACPHLCNSKCKKEPYSEIKLMGKEKMIISNLNVSTKKVLSFRQIYRSIRDNFTLDMFDRLCNECEWYKIGDCRKGFENLKKGGVYGEI